MVNNELVSRIFITNAMQLYLPICYIVFTVVDNDCPYTRMWPKWTYGMAVDGYNLTLVGSCGPGGYFDHSRKICTCTKMGPGRLNP